MFSVSVSYDRDPQRTEQWLRGEGITPIRSFGEAATTERALLERLSQAAAADLRAPFLRLRLDVDHEYARHLRQMDAPLVAERLEAAVRRTLQSEIPRGAGALSVRFEGPDADPRAYVLVLPQGDAEGPRRLLSKADIHALEARWDSELQRAFGVRRGLDRLQLPEDRLPDSPDVRHVRELDHQLRHAVGKARDAIAARMAGTISQERLRAVVERAQDVQDSLRVARQALERRIEMPPVDTVRLRVERGGELLARLPEKEVDRVLLRATQQASGLDPRSAEALRLIAYRSGSDLRVTVYFSDAERPARVVDPEALRVSLRDRLAPELQHAARRLNPLDRNIPNLGRVEVLGVQTIERAGVAASRAPDVPAGPGRSVESAGARPVVVEYRLPRGAEDLANIAPEERSEVLGQAVERAFPFLRDPSIPRQIDVVNEGPHLRVQVSLPSNLGWSREELQGRGFEERFWNAVHRQVTVAKDPAALGRHVGPEDQSFAREVCAKILTGEADRDPQTFRSWLRDGLKSYRAQVPFGPALREASRDLGKGLDSPLTKAWERLARAIPTPMRTAFVFARTVGRIIPRE